MRHIEPGRTTREVPRISAVDYFYMSLVDEKMSDKPISVGGNAPQTAPSGFR